MDYYKPSLRLCFVYLVSTDKVYLKPTITVWMPEGETLISHTPTYNASTRNAELVFDHLEYRSRLDPYLFEHEALIEILPAVVTPYTPNDKPGFIAALRQELASSYTFTVIVNEIPTVPDSGGQGHGQVRSLEGEIVIA
jgi:hypothetical protein